MLRLARAIETGEYSHEQLTEKTQQWIDKSEVFVSVKSLKYIARSGRVNPLKGFIGKLLNLKPIITVNREGKSELLEKSFTENGSKQNLIAHVQKFAKNHKIWGYAITHADSLKTANKYANELTDILKKEPEFKAEKGLGLASTIASKML